ncbi:MAG TPA: tudor domain-containing protein [Anaerolineales bacterium]|nr:tudor domain-containing protein [Anaerolineales bacterium]
MEYWNEGDRVYAYRDEDDYFYPATILEITEEDILIRFDTGEEEWTQDEYLEEYAVAEDEEVECKAAKDDQYYDVTVRSADGDRVEVEFDDGTVEWTTLNRIRFYIEA